ncbi:hypothetical protein BDP27DRAFT_1484933, partial [Rhodocollybia butyracea]
CNNEEPTPCHKIDTAAFTWTFRSNVPQLSPVLDKKLALENFSRDPKTVQSSIISQPDCPGFSLKDWDNLIRGKPSWGISPAKFDHIFLSIHTTSLDEKQT